MKTITRETVQRSIVDLGLHQARLTKNIKQSRDAIFRLYTKSRNELGFEEYRQRPTIRLPAS